MRGIDWFTNYSIKIVYLIELFWNTCWPNKRKLKIGCLTSKHLQTSISLLDNFTQIPKFVTWPWLLVLYFFHISQLCGLPTVKKSVIKIQRLLRVCRLRLPSLQKMDVANVYDRHILTMPRSCNVRQDFEDVPEDINQVKPRLLKNPLRWHMQKPETGVHVLSLVQFIRETQRKKNKAISVASSWPWPCKRSSAFRTDFTNLWLERNII